MKNKILLVIMLFPTVLAVFSCTSLNSYLELKDTEFNVLSDGITSVYEKGTVYRREGFPPQIEVSGSFYEMGVQYGVLLRPEINSFLDDLNILFKNMANTYGVSEKLLMFYLKKETKPEYDKLPEYFKEEIQGISDGSGIPLETIYLLSFFSVALEYDDFYSGSSGYCAGVIVRDEAGELFHGWNYDNGLGKIQNDHSVIINYNPDEKNSHTDIKTLLYLGTQVGYNNKGLSLSNNTIITRGFKDGLDDGIFGRIILEECSSLDDVPKILNTSHLKVGRAFTIADRVNKTGMVVEIIPDEEFIWSITSLKTNALWSTNKLQDSSLSEYENKFIVWSDYNFNREAVLSNYFKSRETQFYSLDNVIDILSTYESESDDELKGLLDDGICNAWNLQSVIIPPAGEGFYLARDESFASLNTFYYISDNFTQEPVIYRENSPLNITAEKVGELLARRDYLPGTEFMSELYDLADMFDSESFVQYFAGIEAFHHSDMLNWKKYCERAYINSNSDIYAVELAAIYYSENRLSELAELLDSINVLNINSIQSLAKYYALSSKLYETNNDERAELYWDKAISLFNYSENEEWLTDYMNKLQKRKKYKE